MSEGINRLAGVVAAYVLAACNPSSSDQLDSRQLATAPEKATAPENVTPPENATPPENETPPETVARKRTNAIAWEKAATPGASLRDSLLARHDTWALFSDRHRVLAISASGEVVNLQDESFDWIRIDYTRGVVWLNRPWSSQYNPGLFLGDLRGGNLRPVRLTRLTSRVRVVSAGESISLDADPPDHYTFSIKVTDRGARLDHDSEYANCGVEDECELSDAAVDVIREASERPKLSDRAVLLDPGKYSVVPEHATCPRCGRVISLVEVPLAVISVDYGDHPGSIGWQLYDPTTKEFISGKTFERSHTPWSEMHGGVSHIMVCSSEALVIDQSFVTADLQRLDDGTFETEGVCLTGGTALVLY